MSYGMICVLYQLYAENISGSDNLLLLGGEDLLLLDNTPILLL